VYCECGATTRLTAKRQAFFPVEEVVSELSHFLSTSPSLDFITFSGDGEPTLSLSIGQVIRYLKEQFPAYRVAILTNGSLLSDPVVRKDLLPADVVLPTLSSVCEETFRAINRPVPSAGSTAAIEGLIRFRREYPGEIWLEIFIIPGLNTTDAELAGLKDAIRRIRPDRVQLNTLDRPGTEGWVRPASPEDLARIAGVLDYAGTDAVKSTFPEGYSPPDTGEPADQIAGLLRRRPSTINDIAAATGLHAAEVQKILDGMAGNGDLRIKREGRELFYYLR
jgi:wyosine [tRNA(Phe)-imidazoG37] synthetase (radical SAM superfamily)